MIMGIRGLTTFITKYADKCFENYEIHDTYLIIDGNNISSHLYKWYCNSSDCFGGDYDNYASVVNIFFNVLRQCNVVPLVIFDGAYEDKKMRTVYSRIRDKIKMAKSPHVYMQMFPLFLREMFVDIVLRLNIKAVRCNFEADYDMACLAKMLNCPVLSYDSDFYIFDVLYIPFSTFNMKVSKTKDRANCIACQIYKVENFLRSCGNLQKEMLPLMAVLLGNDYIKRNMFKNFYNHMKLRKRKFLQSEQQRKVFAIIHWLQYETYESAVIKILGRLKQNKRECIAKQIATITDGYMCNDSEILKLLKIPLPKLLKTPESKLDVYDILSSINSPNESDKSELSSDSDSECLQNSLELHAPQENNCISKVPEWFLEKFQMCLYPSFFVDILARNTFFCIPQVEDYSNIYAHHISTNILLAMHKILTSGKRAELKCVARKEDGLKQYILPMSSVDLPLLNSIQSITKQSGQMVLLKVLEMDLQETKKLLEDFPASWHLYILSLIYWVQNVKPRITNSHIYAIILSIIVLKNVDIQVGYYRSNKVFLKKFEKQILSLEESWHDKSLNEVSIKLLLASLSKEDCLLCLKAVIPYFQLDEKMKNNVKLYDIHFVDAFAQFQSCLYHIKWLSALLNKPYEDFIISDFYNGTFLYNFSVNFSKRNNLDAYVETLLKQSPTILRVFQLIISKLMKILSVSTDKIHMVKRRKRKNKKQCVLIRETSNSNDEPEEELIDENNPFSLLNYLGDKNL